LHKDLHTSREVSLAAVFTRIQATTTKMSGKNWGQSSVKHCAAFVPALCL